MPQVLVRDLDKETVMILKARARRHHRSLQAELKLLLEERAAEPELGGKAAVGLVREMRRLFAGRKFPDSAKLIREDRDR
jgi:plasmid stability protein